MVGGLAVDDSGHVHFQYELSWIGTARELSPLTLPLSINREVRPAPHGRRLHGLHGLLADSLPDAWGMRVLEMRMRRRGVDLQRAGSLDRLAYLGTRTMGALTYLPATEEQVHAGVATSLDELTAQAESIYEGATDAAAYAPVPSALKKGSTSTIDGLELAAGTAGGAQPKVLIAATTDDASLIATADAPDGSTPYVLKFTPRRDGHGLRTDCGPLEHAYALMARDAGLDMPQSRLFRTSDGRHHFAAERFDRTRTGGRRHVHTLGGMLEREASDAGDYDELLRLARALTGDVRTLEEVVRRLSFNLVVLNDDDHLKNIAFLLDPTVGWKLAPAYDVTFSPSRHGERGMRVNGLGADTTWTDVKEMVGRHGVEKQVLLRIQEQVLASVGRWSEFAHAAHVPDASTEELAAAFAFRRSILQR